MIQREHMERLRPLLGQASASLRHGIIVQSRTVPSMVASIGDVLFLLMLKRTVMRMDSTIHQPLWEMCSRV